MAGAPCHPDPVASSPPSSTPLPSSSPDLASSPSSPPAASKPRRPLSPSTPMRPPRHLLLSLPSHTTAAITPRAASKLVARVCSDETSNASSRCLALWPCPSRRCSARSPRPRPARRVTSRARARAVAGYRVLLLLQLRRPRFSRQPPCHRPRLTRMLPSPVLASPTPAWRPARSAALPRAPGHTPARAAPSARASVAYSGSPRGTRIHYGP
nr:predicted GPI-anchored protein 58 [Aegilops tauschii subsp. strangulata]